jgi:hypothetical protein
MPLKLLLTDQLSCGTNILTETCDKVSVNPLTLKEEIVLKAAAFE